jgi:aspartate carbamoyltransferase regulatory subunit
MVHKWIKKGSFVLVEPTGIGLKESYPATNWLKIKSIVKIMEDAPHQGTLDVIDIKLPTGKVESIYDFNIVKKVKI